MAHSMDNPSLYGVLRDMNNCSVCLEEFTNPKFLPCGHTFCLGCLENVYSQSPFGNITCSICRKAHTIPQEGVAGFPNDHRVQQIKDANAIIKRKLKQVIHKDCVICSKNASDLCLDCDETMCQNCSTQHQARKHFSSHAVVKIVDYVECDHHRGKLATRFCMSCSCLVCKVCIICDHSDHDTSLLKIQDSNQPYPTGDPRVIVKKLEAEFQKNEEQCTANIQAIETSSKDFNSAVEAQGQRLIDIILKNTQDIIKKSDAIHKGLMDDQLKHKAELEKGCDVLKKIKIDMAKMFSIHPAAGNIPEKVSLDSFKHDLEAIQPTTIPTSVSQCKFIPTNSLDVGEISRPEIATRGNIRESSPSPVDKELFKKIRSILNKLTPQKFRKLLQQVINLGINTEERLAGTVDITFEMAVSEPIFSVVYANLCKCLNNLKVPAKDNPNKFVMFRQLLLNRCQKEFEKSKADAVDLAEMQRKIEEAPPEAKKKLIEEKLIADQKARRRSLGNIRLIGELYKLKMLPEKTMHGCLLKLLRRNDEDSLEVLCQLLSTIGTDIDHENSGAIMDAYMTVLRKIIDSEKLSSRVRFMIMDVIDLRKSNWIPRRDDNNPKTIEQIHREAQQEEQQRRIAARNFLQQGRGGRRQ